MYTVLRGDVRNVKKAKTLKKGRIKTMTEHRIIYMATVFKNKVKTFDISFKDKQNQYIIDEYGVKTWYKPYLLVEIEQSVEDNDE